jgi:hypothetical protein
VTSASVPGFRLQIPRQLNGAQNNSNPLPLSSNGQPPFEIVVERTDLITTEDDSIADVATRLDTSSTQAISSVINDSESEPNQISSQEFSNDLAASQNEVEEVFNRIFGDDSNEVDKSGFIHGHKLIDNMRYKGNTDTPNDEQRLYTHVVKDIFHLMDMIKP